MISMSNLLPLPVSRSLRPFSNGVGPPQDKACQMPSTNQNFGRSPPLHRRAPNVSRADRAGAPQSTSQGLPRYSDVACPPPSRTLSPIMPNDERQASLESTPGSGFPG